MASDWTQQIIGRRRVSRKELATGAVSTPPRKFGRPQSKTREVRVIAVFPAANVPVPVHHRLGFVPTGYTVVNRFRGTGAYTFAAPGDVYNDNPLPADKRSIVLKCTQANTVAEILVR